MKRITASDARKNWFQLLDEVTAGEVVVIERNGRRLVLARESAEDVGAPAEAPDYSRLLRISDPEAADRWTWEWRGPGEGLAEGPGEGR
jgi:antitoxin (DNA-binding transcriptional repressor) of toxin-antitoxin stability system